ncbi:MAG: heme NO-binding domain-containing protein [Flavobacteriaceae bacterium]|nr:heme NO-binding domain-containing protein [Flavobacteriaceae bacterium]
MKGIVFTEYLEMTEMYFGLEAVDFILENSQLASKGVYTSVGEYDYRELYALNDALSAYTDKTANELMYIYGKHFFGYLRKTYYQFFDMFEDPILMLLSFEDLVYVNLRQQYPDVDFPTYHLLERYEDSIVVVYSSTDGLYLYAVALVEMVFKYFGSQCKVQIDLIEEDGTRVKFSISRQAAD